MASSEDLAKAFEKRLALFGLAQLRNLKHTISSSDNKSSTTPNSFKVYEHTINNGTGCTQFVGETDWDSVYKNVYETQIDIEDFASDVSDDEFQKADIDHQENEDWDFDESAFDDASSIYSGYSRTSRASCTSAGSYTTSCSTTSQHQKKRKSTDEEIKIAAYSMSFCEISKPCKCTTPCSAKLKFAQVFNLNYQLLWIITLK